MLIIIILCLSKNIIKCNNHDRGHINKAITFLLPLKMNLMISSKGLTRTKPEIKGKRVLGYDKGEVHLDRTPGNNNKDAMCD